jgi:hypothetical protein
VTVPIFEWDALGSWEDRRQYLALKLKQRGRRGGRGGLASGLSGLPGGFTSRQVVSRRL